MKRLVLACVLSTTSLAAFEVRADEPAPRSPPFIGAKAPADEERAVSRARELLDRARFLDEAALAAEKTATDLTTRLPNLRIAAKAARDRASRAKAADPERDNLLARAEDLEVDVAVSEAEVSVKRRVAVDNRRVARELRARAVRLVREGADDEPAPVSSCDPPFRYTQDGRKIYRVECLK
jgi:hypothetical protein